jgi:hypothetical protein
VLLEKLWILVAILAISTIKAFATISKVSIVSQSLERS